MFHINIHRISLKKAVQRLWLCPERLFLAGEYNVPVDVLQSALRLVYRIVYSVI